MNRRNFAKTAALASAGLSLGLLPPTTSRASWGGLNNIHLYVIDPVSRNEIACLWFDTECNPKDIKTTIKWLFSQYGPGVDIVSCVPEMDQEDAARRVIRRWVDKHRYSGYCMDDDAELPQNILQIASTPQPDPSP